MKKMDDFTINKFLLSNKVTKDSFMGVFSSNTLPFYSKDFLINDHVLNLVVNSNFKINRKVIDKEFVKIKIARKTAEKNIRS